MPSVRRSVDVRPARCPERPVRRRGWRAVCRAASVALLLTLTACAPTLQLSRPDPGPTPPALAATRTTETVADARLVHWRSFFKDRRLLGLIEAALVHNRDLRIAASRVEEARAQWALARADRWPTLNGAVQARMERTYVDGLANGPARRLDFGLMSPSFEIDFFGRLASLSEAARASFLATGEARRATELALIAQVAELYHAQRQTEELLERTRSVVATRARSVEVLTRARDIGLIQDLELEQAQVQLESARAQRAQLGHVANQIDNVMFLLLGPTPASLPDGLPLEELVASTTLPVGLAADVLQMRPDIAAAEQRLLAAQANLKAARAAFFPRISLTASLGVASAGLSNLFRAGAWAFQPTVALPIFDAGRTQAQYDLAKAREQGVVAEYERTVQQAFREVADQLSARDSLTVQVRASERTLQAQRTRLQIQRQRHQTGLIGLLDVLDAERDLLMAEQSHVALVRTQLDAVVGLYKALGGGAPAQASTVADTGTPAAPRRTDGS